MTETLEALGRRVEAAEELETVTRTMKGLAAVNVRHHERVARALDDYEAVVDAGLQVLLRGEGVRRLAARPRADSGPRSVLAFGSNQGLCGPINRQLGARVATELAHGPPARCVAIGARVAAELDLRGIEVTRVLELPGTVEGITPRAQDLLTWIEERHRGGVGRVSMVFPRFDGRGGRWEPTTEVLVPLDAERLQALAERPWPTRVLPVHRGTWEEALDALTEQALFVRLHRGFAQTMASVSASRLAAMEAAQRNVEERLEELRLRHHRLRQTKITEELLDVVAGFEVLER